VQGLEGGVQLDRLCWDELRHLAPVLLGEVAYEALGNKRDVIVDWRAFVQIVEDTYGLTTEERLIKFFDMRHEVGEGDIELVLRVEARRVQLKASEVECYRAFAPKLGTAF
jgi:hypothetical protein